MKKRKGRPLLIAAAGVALVSFNCEPKDRAVGNLRPVEIDSGPIQPVGNLQLPPSQPDTGAPGPSDAGAASTEDVKVIPPVGNLKPPPTRTAPVGNLRPPPTTK
jgi:hypothetical protein